MKNKKVLFLTQAAMIAAVYVILTEIFAPISFSVGQVRIAEALTILPAFTPAAIVGLFIGCNFDWCILYVFIAQTEQISCTNTTYYF